MNEEVYEGTVIWFNKSYGFITWKKEGKLQTDIFLHYTGISSSERFKSVKKDQKVSFSIGTNHSGEPIAINCLVLE